MIQRRSIRSRIALAASLTALALVASACTLIGQGHLNVANDQSGLGADNSELKVFAHSGSAWPAAGQLGILVQGDDFGKPPAFGLNGTLLLVSTEAACPMSEGAPEAFTLSQVTPIGPVPVVNGHVNQAHQIPDTPLNRASRFAVIDPVHIPGMPGLHLIEVCGTIAYTAPIGAAVDVCGLRDGTIGALSESKAFALDATRKWQFCTGGGAAGSIEKMLWTTGDGGVTWTLISRTTLGNPPAEAGVGTTPNTGAPAALFFTDANNGWLGLGSPGQNLYKSTDGGHNWTPVTVTGLDAGEPVTLISFEGPLNGWFITPDGAFETNDGGATWNPVP